MAEQFHYKLVKSPPSGTEQEITVLLNTYGKAGWELCGMDYGCFIFKISETNLATSGLTISKADLVLHIISEHCNATILDPEAAAEYHDHEHRGPGTIRNHPVDDWSWSTDKAQAILDEACEREPAVQPPVTTVEQCSECGTVLSLIGWQGAGTEEYDCRVCRLRSENSKLADRLAEAEARIVEVEGYGREYIERTDPLIACATAAGESDEPCCGKCNVCLKQRLEQAQTDQQDYNESNQLLGRGDHDAHSLSYRVAKLLRRLEQAEAERDALQAELSGKHGDRWAQARAWQAVYQLCLSAGMVSTGPTGQASVLSFIKSLAALREERERLQTGLAEAVDLIRNWHSLGLADQRIEGELWRLYRQSPEMQRLLPLLPAPPVTELGEPRK